MCSVSVFAILALWAEEAFSVIFLMAKGCAKYEVSYLVHYVLRTSVYYINIIICTSSLEQATAYAHTYVVYIKITNATYNSTGTPI